MLTASDKARRYLSVTADHLREGYVAPAITNVDLAVTWSVAIDTYVAGTLVKAAEFGGAVPEWGEMVGDIDVIALATHGRDGLQRWVTGSVTAAILLGTKLPLLIVPLQRQRKPAQKHEQEEGRRITGNPSRRGHSSLHLVAFSSFSRMQYI